MSREQPWISVWDDTSTIKFLLQPDLPFSTSPSGLASGQFPRSAASLGSSRP